MCSGPKVMLSAISLLLSLAREYVMNKYGDVPQAPAIPAGFFQRHQAQIARHLLAAAKALRLPDDQHEGQCGENYCNAVADDCSLRQAVINANATAGADTIVLPAGTEMAEREGFESA